LVGKYDIEFIEADAPITDPVTKFGVQPVWLERPEWPLSKELGRQMQFVCQIALDPDIFGVSPGKMAYLFITGRARMSGWMAPMIPTVVRTPSSCNPEARTTR
jgi:hypothetical protein